MRIKFVTSPMQWFCVLVLTTFCTCRIWGSGRDICEVFYLLGYNLVQSAENQQTFHRKVGWLSTVYTMLYLRRQNSSHLVVHLFVCFVKYLSCSYSARMGNVKVSFINDKSEWKSIMVCIDVTSLQMNNVLNKVTNPLVRKPNLVLNSKDYLRNTNKSA
jgi:hypothetical protein